MSTTTKSTIQRLTRDAEAIRNTNPHDLQTMEVGDEFRQGDCRIKRLPDNAHKHADLEEVAPIAQLAPGNTPGSRHCLASIRGVRMFRLKSGNPLDGPVLMLSEPNGITHPEHGHVVNLPAGCYAVPGQRSFADEVTRVAD